MSGLVFGPLRTHMSTANINQKNNTPKRKEQSCIPARLDALSPIGDGIICPLRLRMRARTPFPVLGLVALHMVWSLVVVVVWKARSLRLLYIQKNQYREQLSLLSILFMLSVSLP